MAAKVVGVSGRTVSDAKAIQKASPEMFAKVLKGDKSIPEAKRALRKRANKNKQKAAAEQAAKNPTKTWTVTDKQGRATA